MGDHGLDGECVSWLHDADCLVLGVVGDVGGAVEEAVDAVPAVRPHHGEALRLRVLLDHVAHVPVLRMEDDNFEEVERQEGNGPTESRAKIKNLTS